MTDPMASEPAEPTTRQDPEWLAGMIFTATGPHFLAPDETREVAAALAGDQPTAHALVEERDDAAGDLP